MPISAPTSAVAGHDDETLIRLWLHGRPDATRRNYEREIRRLRATLAGVYLREAQLADLQEHLDSLAHLAPRSRALAVSALKSFYAFHVKTQSLAANPAAPLPDVAVPQDLAERILDAGDVAKLISSSSGADRLVLRLLYLAGLRASELCALRWRNLSPRDDGGQVTVFGKGGKTRVVLIPAEVWAELAATKGDARPSDPVFPSPRDTAKPLGQRQLLRIVKRAAAAAGLTGKISNHWLRHAHASHALDAGAPIQLVRDTLGHSSIATTNKYAHARPNDGSARFLPRG